MRAVSTTKLSSVKTISVMTDEDDRRADDHSEPALAARRARFSSYSGGSAVTAAAPNHGPEHGQEDEHQHDVVAAIQERPQPRDAFCLLAGHDPADVLRALAAREAQRGREWQRCSDSSAAASSRGRCGRRDAAAGGQASAWRR